MTEPVTNATITIQGREIEVVAPTEVVVALIAREANKLKRSSVSGQDKMKAVGRILDFLENCIVNEADKDYLVDLALNRELELQDMFGILDTFTDPEQAPAKPVVRRGRPPKR